MPVRALAPAPVDRPMYLPKLGSASRVSQTGARRSTHAQQASHDAMISPAKREEAVQEKTGRDKNELRKTVLVCKVSAGMPGQACLQAGKHQRCAGTAERHVRLATAASPPGQAAQKKSAGGASAGPPRCSTAGAASLVLLELAQGGQRLGTPAAGVGSCGRWRGAKRGQRSRCASWWAQGLGCVAAALRCGAAALCAARRPLRPRAIPPRAAARTPPRTAHAPQPHPQPHPAAPAHSPAMEV